MKKFLTAALFMCATTFAAPVIIDLVNAPTFSAGTVHSEICFDLCNVPTKFDYEKIKQMNDIVQKLGATSVSFTNAGHITKIGNDFLSNCSELVTLDLSALSNVIIIRGFFYLAAKD